MNQITKTISALSLAILLLACGGAEKSDSIETLIAAKDLDGINAKRDELASSKSEIETQMDQLDAAIAELDSSKKLPLITVLPLKEEMFHHYIEIQGDVKTNQNLLIYPEIQGILKKFHVKMGDEVKAGDLLASIDDGGMNDQLESLKIQAALAKTTFERQERLWKKDIGSEIQYLNAKTNYEASQKAVEQVQSQVEKASIRAPFSGIIDDLVADEGQLVAPGQSALIRLVNLSEMYVESNVPENYLTTVKTGNTAHVHFPVLDTVLKAKVSEVGNYINPDNRTFRIEIALPGASQMVKPNLMAKVEVNDYNNPKAILIPQSLISENSQGQQYVYLAKTEKNATRVYKQIIRTGKQQGDLVEVRSGLTANSAIVKEGARTVKDQQEVKIIK